MKRNSVKRNSLKRTRRRRRFVPSRIIWTSELWDRPRTPGQTDFHVKVAEPESTEPVIATDTTAVESVEIVVTETNAEIDGGEP